MRPARLRRSAGQRIVRRADHARTGEFRHQQISPVRIPAFHRGAGHRQTGCRHRQPRDGASLRRTFRSHIAGLPRNHGGQVPRVFPRGYDSGRRGHHDQHERQRGHRQPCAGDHGARARRISVLLAQRPRQLFAVDQRRLPFGHPPRALRHAPRTAPAPRSADRSLCPQGRRVRPRAQDGAHAVAGRRTHDPRADVPRFCERPAGRGRQPRPRGTGVPVDQHGRHGHRHGHLRRAGLCRALYGGYPGDHRLGRDAGRRPRRSDVRHGLHGRLLLGDEAHRVEDEQDLQRPAAAVVGPAAGWASSTSRHASPVRRSCPARSTP